jgi:hypothetical protein
MQEKGFNSKETHEQLKLLWENSADRGRVQYSSYRSLFVKLILKKVLISIIHSNPIYYLLFTIYYLLFIIYYLLFIIYYLLFIIYYLLFRQLYIFLYNSKSLLLIKNQKNSHQSF